MAGYTCTSTLGILRSARAPDLDYIRSFMLQLDNIPVIRSIVRNTLQITQSYSTKECRILDYRAYACKGILLHGFLPKNPTQNYSLPGFWTRTAHDPHVQHRESPGFPQTNPGLGAGANRGPPRLHLSSCTVQGKPL